MVTERQPCGISHWAALSTSNHLAAQGWLSHLARGRDAFFADVGSAFLRDARPIERGALVVLGATFPQDLAIRIKLKTWVSQRDRETAVAAVYALTEHLYVDEGLQDWATITVIKLRASVVWHPVQRALADVLDIYQTAGGSRKCARCRAHSELPVLRIASPAEDTEL